MRKKNSIKIEIKKEDLPKPRRSWNRNPATRVKVSNKIYNRKREKDKIRRDTDED